MPSDSFVSNNSGTPLLFEVFHNNVSKIALLLECGVDVNKCYQETALMSGCRNGKESLEAVAELLKSPEIDVNLKSQDGETALMHAAANKEGGKYLLPKLLAAGADQNIKYEEDETALIRAAFVDNLEAIEILMNDKRTEPEFLLSEARVILGFTTSEEIKTFLNGKIPDLETIHQDKLFEEFTNFAFRAFYDVKTDKRVDKVDLKHLASFFAVEDFDVNHVNSKGSTILTFAAIAKNKELLDFIIKEKSEEIDFGKSIKILDDAQEKKAADLLRKAQTDLRKTRKPKMKVEASYSKKLVPPSQEKQKA